MFRCFEVRVDNLRIFLFLDVWKYKIKVVGLKLWDHESMVKAIRAVRKKEMGYFAASMKYNLSPYTLYHYVHYNWNFS
jgi:aspartyl/asparaginyl beta-hydroxylase (cupin superfamily)